MGQTERTPVQKNLYERVSKLLESYEWSDCSFSVSGKKFKAHRLILAISSPVFKAMFYGPLSNTEDIDISDIEPDIFQKLINYIYTDKVEITCLDDALDLLYAAKKYLLEYLKEKCIDFIEACLSVDNVISVLNYSYYFQEDRLISCSIKLFCEHADYLMKHHLEKLTYTCLKNILKCEHMNISEKNLILSVFEWTTYYCEQNSVTPTYENRRKVLMDNNLLKALRFGTLTNNDLIDIIKNESNILTVKEIDDIKKYIEDHCPDSVSDADLTTICLNNNSRDMLSVPWYLCHRSTVRSAPPLVIDNNRTRVHVRVGTNKTVFVNSLCVPTRMSPLVNFHCDSPVYSEQFSVSVLRESDNSVVKFINFMNNVDYDSNVLIEFPEPCILNKNEWYKIMFSWPTNRFHLYRYIVSYRNPMYKHNKVCFEFEDSLDGSFLESIKYSL